MSRSILKSLSLTKYEQLFLRIFEGATHLEVRDQNGKAYLQVARGNSFAPAKSIPVTDTPAAAWAMVSSNMERQYLDGGQVHYRTPISVQSGEQIGWLIAGYSASQSTPLATATDALLKAFAEAIDILQVDLDLQLECDQLAIELTERYEELNLVYSTKDQVEYFEEGQAALVRLVHNCADYLNVGLATLICRDRGLLLQHTVPTEAPVDSDSILDLLNTVIYDRVESQVACVILNEMDDTSKQRLLPGHDENILAYPVLDDHGTVIGVLGVVARKESHSFSNGDRNLLEVMAKKASRIIHTHHDSLTGLMNRNGFESLLVTSIGTAQRKNTQHCLLHIDIDQLHVINDLMGHQEGDALIRRVAKSLRSKLRDTDYLARLGGDEFSILLTACTLKQGTAVAEKIRSAIAELRVVTANRRLDVTASIGIIAVGADSDGIVSVMAAAEIACKSAKDHGRDRIETFEKDDTKLIRRSEELGWIGRVQQALREDQFRLFCQPVLPLADGNKAPHYEILIRLLDDNGEILLPTEFLPAAERYQLMPLIDRWVIRHTLQALDPVWDDLAVTGAVFCINLSGQSLTNTGFTTFVLDELRQSRVASDRICFEITETAAISNFTEANSFFEEMKSLGCRFALDDFGAGLSSFGYLKVLPVDYLKIDGSFIKEIVADRISRSMVEAICQIGRTMELSMIAEFVGDDETVEILRGFGVDYVQGFHIGKPAPILTIIDDLRNQTSALSACR